WPNNTILDTEDDTTNRHRPFRYFGRCSVASALTYCESVYGEGSISITPKYCELRGAGYTSVRPMAMGEVEVSAAYVLVTTTCAFAGVMATLPLGIRAWYPAENSSRSLLNGTAYSYAAELAADEPMCIGS